jgi:hypothetical protein
MGLAARRRLVSQLLMGQPRHIPSPFFDGCAVLALVVVVKAFLVASMVHTVFTQGAVS